jgi:hypothetical protein
LGLKWREPVARPSEQPLGAMLWRAAGGLASAVCYPGSVGNLMLLHSGNQQGR